MGIDWLDQGGYVYFLENPHLRLVKIGFATDVARRVAELDSSESLLLIGYLPGTIRTERWLHEKFGLDRQNGEWFYYSTKIRAFVETVGLVGGPGPRRRPYSRNCDPAAEDAATNEVLVERLMQIARGEVRRYLHAIIVAAEPEWQRKARSERTKAALERAQRDGQRLGRPFRDFDRERAKALRADGKSWASIAAELGVPRETIRRAVAAPSDVPKSSQATAVSDAAI